MNNLAALSQSLPSPSQSLARADRIDAWPAFTTHTASDVIVAAISLTRLVEWCGTPCVHTAEAVIPRSGGRPSSTDMDSVVVTRVLAVELHSDLTLWVTVDAELGGAVALLSEARLIGHDADQSEASVILNSPVEGSVGHVATLPATVAAGDLIAIPCRGITMLHAVRPSGRLSPELPSSAPYSSR